MCIAIFIHGQHKQVLHGVTLLQFNGYRKCIFIDQKLHNNALHKFPNSGICRANFPNLKVPRAPPKIVKKIHVKQPALSSSALKRAQSTVLQNKDQSQTNRQQWNETTRIEPPP